MRVIALDIGNEVTAVVIWHSENLKIEYKDLLPNNELFLKIQNDDGILMATIDEAIIEMIASYGNAMGQETVDTAVWVGMFRGLLKSKGLKTKLIFRRTVKLHHCGNTKATDSHVTAALVNKYGQPDSKKRPNLLYRTEKGRQEMQKDIWAAFALATYVTEFKDYEANWLEGEVNKLSKSLLDDNSDEV